MGVKRLILAITLVVVVLGILNFVYSQEVAKEQVFEGLDYKVFLKSREFIPIGGISETAFTTIKEKSPLFAKTHVLIQFYKIPSKEEKQFLRENGVELLSYIPNKAWFASIPTTNPDAITFLPNVRAIELIKPNDKIDPFIRNHGVGNWARNEDGAVRLTVLFFEDVSLEKGTKVIENEFSGTLIGRAPIINALVVSVQEPQIFQLAQNEFVKWIALVPPPPRTMNDGARVAIEVEDVQISPYDLNGENIQVGEWDSGWVDSTHDDMVGRVTIGDSATCGGGSDTGTCGFVTHSTHVGGTVLGDGTLSAAKGGSALQWRGMAPIAEIISYEWWDNSAEIDFEYNQAINTYGIEISQNSWGYNYISGSKYGRYDSDTAAIDAIVSGDKGKRISITWAAGNERPDCDAGQYDCIIHTATSKNVISVGAINSNDDSMTSFSSWGPTDDGRFKPEVVAPGCQVGGDGGIKSTIPGDDYGVFCGTSMATPATSGGIALLIQEYRRIFGKDPWPSTVKALLIQKALDLGNIGPDYSNGFGKIRVKQTVDLMRKDAGSNVLIVEDSVTNQGEIDDFTINVPSGQSELKVTLVWDDFKGDPAASKALVNDLDLNLISPSGVTHFPYILDPNNPANPATTGVDTLNNYEQIVVSNPESGNWALKVKGTIVPNPDQNYSLTSDLNVLKEPGVELKTFNDSSYSVLDKFFDAENTVFIEAFIAEGGEPLLDAIVSVDLILSNNTVEENDLVLSEVGSGFYRNSWDSSGHTSDVYLVKATVNDLDSTTGQTNFHLYSGSGVSAYKMDVKGDGVKDFVLENKHLITAFEKNSKLISFLFQKDTSTEFNFKGTSDLNSIGRGEVSTQNLKDINILSLGFSFFGENLLTSTLIADINVSDPIEKFLCPSGSNECAVANGYFFKNGTNQIDCTSTYTSDDGSQVDDCSFSTQQDGGKGAFMQCEFDVSDIPSGSILNNVEEHINMEINLFNSTTSGTFELQYFDCSTNTYVSGETIQLPGGSGGETDFFSQNYASTFSWWEQCSGTLKFRWFLNSNWVGPAAFDYLDMCSLEVSYFLPAITTNVDLNIEMRTDEVDYLVYKLHNFDALVDDVNDLFSPLAGTLGNSVSDDRYHFADGSDDLVTNLSSNQWNDFDLNYVSIYDDSTLSDSVQDNIVAWVRFDEIENTINFDKTGLWFDSSNQTGALRIKYDTTLGTTTDELIYLLVFTKGNFLVLDQWISTINSKQFPSPNFFSSPGVEFVSITLTGFPVDFSNVDPGTNNNAALGNVSNQYIITVDPTTNVNVDLYQLGNDFSGPDTILISNMKTNTANNSGTATNMSSTYTLFQSNILPNTAVNSYYWLDIPLSKTAGNYSANVSIKAVKIGDSP